MELNNNKVQDNNAEYFRTFDVIVSPCGGGDEPQYCVGLAFHDKDDAIYVHLNPFTVLQDSSRWAIRLVRRK